MRAQLKLVWPDRQLQTSRPHASLVRASVALSRPSLRTALLLTLQCPLETAIVPRVRLIVMRPDLIRVTDDVTPCRQSLTVTARPPIAPV